MSGSGDSYTIRAPLFNGVTEEGKEYEDEFEQKWSESIMKDGEIFGTALVSCESQCTFSQYRALEGLLCGDIVLLASGFRMLFVYLLLLGGFCVVRPCMLLGISTPVNAELELGVTFGLKSDFGMVYGQVHKILPLIFISFGVYYAFVVTRTPDDINPDEKLKHNSMCIRVTLALCNMRSVISVTLITNSVAFLLSAVTQLPTLRFFALWAETGIF